MVLAGAVGLQIMSALRTIPQTYPDKRLNVLVPTRAGEWVVRDEPLGRTETSSEAALKTLNLEDYVYRRYSRGDTSFSVYVAYWGPGRMPTRLVASHTPDRCWTENGMRCVEMSFRKSYALGGKPLLPAEYREFTPPGASASRPNEATPRTYVAYWHTVEGRLYDYGGRFNAVPHPWLWWKDTLAQAAYGSREQLFVRIASNMPLEQLWTDPEFQRVMESTANLGLWDTAAKPR